MTAATAPEQLDWSWRDQLAAGHFRKVLHRVRPGARTIRLDGETYYVADCGAVAVPTNEPPEDWDFCDSCWPRGLLAITNPMDNEPSPTPSAPPDCLNWDTHYAASVTGPAPATASLAPNSTTPGFPVGWFEAST